MADDNNKNYAFFKSLHIFSSELIKLGKNLTVKDYVIFFNKIDSSSKKSLMG